MYKHPQPLILSTHIQKKSRGNHLNHNNNDIQPYGSFSPGKWTVFFQRSAATGMVDRICQGDDDAALDRKQQAAEVLGDGMGWYGDWGMMKACMSGGIWHLWYLGLKKMWIG